MCTPPRGLQWKYLRLFEWQVCNNNMKKEAVTTRSTTTPGTVAGSVGRARTSGRRIREMIEK